MYSVPILIRKVSSHYLSTLLQNFIIGKKLVNIRINLHTIVVAYGFQSLAGRIPVSKFCFQQTDQHQCRKTGGEMRPYVFIGPDIGRAVFPLFFGIFFRIIDHLFLVNRDSLLLFYAFAGDIYMESFGMDPGFVYESDFPAGLIGEFFGKVAPYQYPFLEFRVRSPDRLAVDITIFRIFLRFVVPIQVINIV